MLGLFLRLYLLPDQLLLDDEWHALDYTADKSLPYLLAHLGAGANCVPQNIYTALVLRTAGWSELALRLPSVVCGALALVVFPFLISKIWNGRVALIFAYLFAVSPCAIFYSRLCRPYSMVLFFGMLALLLAFLWAREDKREHMLGYALSAFAAVYFHLYAALVVLPPLICVALARALKKAGGVRSKLPSYRNIGLAAGIILALSALLIVPPNLMNPWWLDAAGFRGYGGATRRTLLNLLALLSGTDARALQISFLALTAAGLSLVLREDRLRGAMILAALFCFSVKIGLSEQFGMDVAIQVARYGIILFPVATLLAAIALAQIMEKAAWGVQAFIAAGLAAVLIFFGPLRSIYRTPNNFTNHSAFQYAYEPTDWSVSRDRGFFEGLVLRKENIPVAYLKIASAADPAGVIEYPMLLGDDFDPYYYYQHFHRKPVAVGYLRRVQYGRLVAEGQGDEGVHGDTPVGYVLNRVPPELAGKIHFRNVVALDDVDRLKGSLSGWDIIIHHQLLSEMFPDRVQRKAVKPNAYVQGLMSRLNAAGIPAIYQDDLLSIFRIP